MKTDLLLKKEVEEELEWGQRVRYPLPQPSRSLQRFAVQSP
jgi:hypothetical protein